MALQQATKVFEQFKGAFAKNDVAAAGVLLSQLKLALIQLPALPPAFGASPTAQQELLLAREVLEQAVLLSLKARDEAAMERAFAQLQTFYADTRTLLPASKQEVVMQGLNLLRLLVQNRISEFHTELELVTAEAQQDANIRQPVQLEQWLMEGAYNKVLAASKQDPSEHQASLMAQLTTTVRDEIASCSEKAYERLRLGDAQEMMMFASEAEARAYAEQHGWRVEGEYIMFPAVADAAAEAGRPGQVPSMALINNALAYAKELERIV